ncbi:MULTISPECIES: DUF3263 domain-containing protein [Streptomyces]|uniref:DUF3263 domain-containing protein n=1 Tax=Streptomyces ramulosus TaxID=47762 RepID=A0ABW1FKB0_9ACTN
MTHGEDGTGREADGGTGAGVPAEVPAEGGAAPRGGPASAPEGGPAPAPGGGAASVPERGAEAAAPDSRAEAATPEGAHAAPAAPAPGELSALDKAVLAVERRSWPSSGPKERYIRERLHLSPTRYYQLLNALLDDARALRHDPGTVHRLRLRREARRGRR